MIAGNSAYTHWTLTRGVPFLCMAIVKMGGVYEGVWREFIVTDVKPQLKVLHELDRETHKKI